MILIYPQLLKQAPGTTDLMTLLGLLQNCFKIKGNFTTIIEIQDAESQQIHR